MRLWTQRSVQVKTRGRLCENVGICETDFMNITKMTEKQRALKPNQLFNSGEKF